MSPGTRDWLPAGASLREGVRSKLAEAIDGWSSHWFAGKGFQIRRILHTSPAIGWGKGEGWVRFGSELSLRILPNGATKILESALDMSLDGQASSPADKQLLHALRDKIAADLVARIELHMGSAKRDLETTGSNTFGADGGLDVGLAQGEGPEVIALAIPLANVLPLIRRSLSPPKSAPPLATLKSALGSVPVNLEVVLGQAPLSLSDLSGLSPGDIVELGVDLRDSAQLRVQGSHVVCADGLLTEAEGAAALALKTCFV